MHHDEMGTFIKDMGSGHLIRGLRSWRNRGGNDELQELDGGGSHGRDQGVGLVPGEHEFSDNLAPKQMPVKVRSQKKKRYYLGIFPNMGGGSSQIPKLL